MFMVTSSSSFILENVQFFHAKKKIKYGENSIQKENIVCDGRVEKSSSVMNRWREA